MTRALAALALVCGCSQSEASSERRLGWGSGGGSTDGPTSRDSCECLPAGCITTIAELESLLCREDSSGARSRRFSDCSDVVFESLVPGYYYPTTFVVKDGVLAGCSTITAVGDLADGGALLEYANFGNFVESVECNGPLLGESPCR